MSIKKQKLSDEIETLPEEFIKSKKDLKEKLQKGLDDINSNKTKTIEEVFNNIASI